MYTQKKPIENTHIVRERDRRRFRELLAVLSLGVPVGLFLLLFTWQNLEVIRLGHEATRLQKELKQIASSNKALQLELDRLTALDSVEQQAVALGFERTPATSIVMVAPSDGDVRAAVAAASSETAPPAAVAQRESRSRTAGREEAGGGLQSAIHVAQRTVVAAATPSDGRR